MKGEGGKAGCWMLDAVADGRRLWCCLGIDLSYVQRLD